MGCLLLVAGCSPKADVTVHDSDNGRHIELTGGQLFDIVLADDYETSKCQWRDEQKYDTAVLKLLGSEYAPPRNPPSGGATGTFTSRYRAGSAGTVHVELVQEDQESTANPPHVVRRYAIDVTVR